MKKGKKSEPVTICPRCYSTDVSGDFSNPVLVATGLFNSYNKCNHCGHTAIMFPQVPKSRVPKKPKNIKDIKEKRTLVDTSYGRGLTATFKIFVPMVLIMSITYYFAFLKTIENNWFSLFLMMWVIPTAIFLTFFSYRKNFFLKNKKLRLFAAFFIFYTYVGGMIILILMAYFFNLQIH